MSKAPYNFEFLGLSGGVAERDLEQRLTDRIVETLRAPGPGFAFVDRIQPEYAGRLNFYVAVDVLKRDFPHDTVAS